MSARILVEGSAALAEAAVQAGCRFYAGYPITPSTEILEYMSTRLPAVGGVCMNAESEIEAIGMVWGAAGSGVRAMTASDRPGHQPDAGELRGARERTDPDAGRQHGARPRRLFSGDARRRPR